MKVLRDNKESLMAVLEAFVYDPLINWRLMQAEPETRPPDSTFSVVSARGFPMANLYYCAAEMRSQELTRVTAYPQGPLRKLKADENDIFNGKGISLVVRVANDPPPPAFPEAQETRNERALAVYNRVQHKLTGTYDTIIDDDYAS